jgi:hypothetical protein
LLPINFRIWAKNFRFKKFAKVLKILRRGGTKLTSQKLL